ncbi:response regulator [Pseudonocardia endophytica]|uniref:LuxR family two component transcriptional regulator n=1 Tax=Pseudonocardia endophytica TaxID=401976 RepID=A0A4R1HU56_PSEEN|nr:response regulator transcription factor [Pseudonocardia endophytica]TCK24465.1 LuxR family two component transcriptional regulator [Pseudonocardia endophytica]
MSRPTIRVVIADDHAVVRHGLAQLLGTADDIEVVGDARDGTEAVRVAADLEPDVVLMDLSMPGTDGVDATKAIKTGPSGARVLVLTSFSEQARVLAALDAGADGYLLKHAEPEAILDGVRQVVDGGVPLDAKAARVLIDRGAQARPLVSDDGLTGRERDVLELLGKGLSNKQIGRRLDIAERTVKAHLTHVFQRLGVTDRTQAALWAQRHLEQ